MHPPPPVGGWRLQADVLVPVRKYKGPGKHEGMGWVPALWPAAPHATAPVASFNRPNPPSLHSQRHRPSAHDPAAAASSKGSLCPLPLHDLKHDASDGTTQR